MKDLKMPSKLKEYYGDRRVPPHEWEAEMHDLHTSAKAIIDKAKAENREPTDAEAAEFDTLMERHAEDAIELEASRKVLNAYKAKVLAKIGAAQGNGTGPLFRTSDGQTIRALRHTDAFAPSPRDFSALGYPSATLDGEPPARVGDVLQAMLTGDYRGASMAQVRAAIGSSDSAGGYLLNPTLSGQVVDLARSASVCLRAGALTLPMDSAELNIARLTGDPTASWRPEGVAVTSSELTFDRVTLRPRTLAAIVPVSIELLEDASNAGAIIEQALMAKLGLTLDQAILRGAGAESEPLGIKNHPTVGTTTSVGAPDDYQEVTSAIGAIYTANYQGEPNSLSWVMNPREAKKYDSLEDSTGQPLMPTPWSAAVQRFMTTSMPTTEGGGAESSMIIGDFSQCVIGMRTSGVVIRVAQDGSVSDGTNTINATSQLMRLVVAYMRVDVALLRPTWFNVLSGVTA